MKIGIITICKVNNYGAELQAFATQKQLEQMGHKVEIIDYLYYKNWKFKDTALSQPFIATNIKGKFMYWLKYRFVNWAVDKLYSIKKKSEENKIINLSSIMDAIHDNINQWMNYIMPIWIMIYT